MSSCLYLRPLPQRHPLGSTGQSNPMPAVWVRRSTVYVRGELPALVQEVVVGVVGLYARTAVGAIADPEAEAARLRLDHRHVDRHIVGRRRIGRRQHQGAGEATCPLQPPLILEQRIFAVRVAGAGRVEIGDKLLRISLLPLDPHGAKGDRRPAVDFDTQACGMRLRVDLGAARRHMRGGESECPEAS